MTPASWFHCSKGIIKRSAGRSVVAAAAYRTGTSIDCEREMQTHDYTRKRGVMEVFTATPEGKENLEWAHDVSRLANAMENTEKRKDSQLAHEWTIALPSALDAGQRSQLAHDLAQQLSDRYGVAVIGAIHAPGREGDERNHHVHLLFTTRQVEENGKLGAKVTSLTGLKTGPEEVKRFRFITAELINGALEDGGSDERVDARSYAERGLDIEPTTHLGPAASAMERRGGDRSDRGDINREILEDRLRWQQEQAQPEIDASTGRELAERFGDPDPSPDIQAEAARVERIIEDVRVGPVVPLDVVEHMTAGMEPLDEDTAAGGRSPPPVPRGWLARMKAIAAELMDLLRDESGTPQMDAQEPDSPRPGIDTETEPDHHPGTPAIGHEAHPGHSHDHDPHHHATDHPKGWQAQFRSAGEKLKSYAELMRARAATIIGNQRGNVPDWEPPEIDLSEYSPFAVYLAEALEGDELELGEADQAPDDGYTSEPAPPEPEAPDYDIYDRDGPDFG